jgi:hypothetical protein
LYQKKVIHVVPENMPVQGEIGQFIEGLLGSEVYLKAVKRSVIIGPMASGNDTMMEWIQRDGAILYSSHTDIARHPYGKGLLEVERKYGVSLVYAHQPLRGAKPEEKRFSEILLIDAGKADLLSVNALKAWLYEEFGIESIRYEKNREYETYVKFAPAALAALRAIGVADPSDPGVLIAHDYMGLPTILAAVMDPLGSYKTVFYAHQEATARRIVENYPGHDTMFYTALNCSRMRDYYLSDVFGPQDFFFQNTLINAARYCDSIIAASEQVAGELRFLGPAFQDIDIDVSYYGLPAQTCKLEDKIAAKRKLQDYAQKRLGFTPETIFTHVSHMGLRKGLWRDLRVLEHLDQEYQKQGQHGLLFLLNTVPCSKNLGNADYMGNNWKWPVDFLDRNNQLPDSEAAFYAGVQAFNTQAKNIQVILVDPLGFYNTASGKTLRMEIDVCDIRRGSDVEFGQSIYEPFGRTTLEALANGSLVVCNRICGSLELIEKIAGGKLPDSVIVADYTERNHPDNAMESLESILAIDQGGRDLVEHAVSGHVARLILERLPRSEDELRSRIAWGLEFAAKINWDSVCQQFFLPALNHAYHRRRARRTA